MSKKQIGSIFEEKGNAIIWARLGPKWHFFMFNMTEEELRSKMEENKQNIDQEETLDTSVEGTPEQAGNTNEAGPEITIESLQLEIEGLNDKYIRLLAEFDNFRRRSAKERIELISTANANTLKSMLSVLDDFDRAQKSIEAASDVLAVKEGINLVHQKLKNTLQSQGLKEMDSTVGLAFNTDLHEAITNIPAPTEEMKGKVVDELEKGYLLNETVIRFAKVVVGA